MKISMRRSESLFALSALVGLLALTGAAGCVEPDADDTTGGDSNGGSPSHMGGGGSGAGAQSGGGPPGGGGGETGGQGGCAAPMADCNGDPSDGCEVDTSTDFRNCGACFTDCEYQGSCVDDGAFDPTTVCSACAAGSCQPAPELLMSGQVYSTARLAIDGGELFWSENAPSGGVYSMPVAGGAATAIASGQPRPHALVLDDTTVYWSTEGSSDPYDTTIVAAPKDGSGNPVTLATGLGVINNMAIDAQALYAVEWHAYVSDGAVVKIPLAAPSIIDLTDYSQGSPTFISVDEGTVYFTKLTGAVATLPKNGGAPSVLSSAAALDLAVDATHVYWLDAGPSDGQGSVRRIPKGGGTPDALLTGLNAVLKFDQAVAVDSTHVYAVAGLGQDGPSTLFKVPKSGGPMTPLATHVYGRDIAVDATHVYFLTCCNPSGIARVPK